MKVTTGKLLPLYMVILLASLGYSMMITVFTPLLIYYPEGSLAERMIWLGCLLALYPLGQFFGAPLITRLAFRWGRKATYFASLGVTAVGYGWIALSLERFDLIALGASVFLTGLAESNFSIAEHTITDMALKYDQPQWISYVKAGTDCAFLVGPILAGILSRENRSDPFWFVSFFLLATVFWLAYKLPSMGKAEVHPQIWKVLKRRPIGPFFLNFLVYFAVFGFFRAYPMELVHKLQLDVLSLSLYIVWVAIPIVAVNFSFTAQTIKYFPPRKTVAFGTFFLGFFMLILPLVVHIQTMLLLDLMLIGVGIGFSIPISPILIAGNATKREKMGLLETDSCLLSGSEALSSLIGGVLAAMMFRLPLIVFAVAALTVSLILSRKRSFA